MTIYSWDSSNVAMLVLDERRRQDDKWGEQNHPDYGGPEGEANAAALRRFFALRLSRIRETEARHRREGLLGWDCILLEEVYEALSEDDDDKLEAELVQVSAVAQAWIECIRRRREGSNG